MKKKIRQTIFEEHSDKPLVWKQIKENVVLEDDDEIQAGYCEPYYSENNSHDGYYYVQVTRMVEETDEQYEKRVAREEAARKERKANRYKTYLNLKKEFDEKPPYPGNPNLFRV